MGGFVGPSVRPLKCFLRANAQDENLRADDKRSHIVPEALELMQLVGNGPDEDALHARLRECPQLLGEQFGRPDGETILP